MFWRATNRSIGESQLKSGQAELNPVSRVKIEHGASVLRYRKGTKRLLMQFLCMTSFVYRCPNMGLNVQGWSAEDATDDGMEPMKPCAA